MKTIKSIDSVLCKVFRYLTYVSGIVGALMMILAVVNVISRTFFKAPIFGTVEIISYSALLLGAFALPLNELSDGNITMTLLTDNIKPKPRRVFELFTSLIAAVFYFAISFRYVEEVLTTIQKATRTTTVRIPFWCVNTVMAIGFFAGALALLLKAARAVAYIIWGDEYQKGGGGA